MESSDETIDYPRLVLEALREVPRRALAQVAEEGMPGKHHFYITFRTSDPEVEVPAFLREQYPEETTIILQHQFWSLSVDEKAFSVVLSFGGRRQQLYVPFAALTAFADPSASFSLRFDAPPVPAEELSSQGETAPSEAVPAPAGGEAGEVLRFDPSRRR
jgi:hypothetical protein